ncbi:MAG: triphosphoribosyl-dephospho-CoA synthase [Candidatus Velthaea sp.]
MSARLARAASAALLAELATTPKPGLVDLEHCGAHRDLCADRLASSAYALESVFAELARCGAGAPPSPALREEIGAIGRRGERAMLRASGGSNTHRGALWTLGLLVTAAAGLPHAAPAAAIAARAGCIATLPDRFGASAGSNGAGATRRYGAAGARGEAAAGFPHVIELALPQLRAGRPHADVLLALLSRVDDTCVLHRGGLAARAIAQRGAREALRAGGVETAAGLRRIHALDAELVARNASPGGCADLLAAAFFLDTVAQ